MNIKRLVLGIMASVMIVSMSIASYASTPQEIKVYVNGTMIQFDQQPVIINDRVMIPVRHVAEALGYGIAVSQWNGDFGNEMTIMLMYGVPDNQVNVIGLPDDNITWVRLFLKPDVDFATSQQRVAYAENIETGPLLVVPKVINGRTVVGVRDLGNLLQATVDWNGDTRTVTVTSSGGNVVAPPLQVTQTVPPTEPTSPPSTSNEHGYTSDIEWLMSDEYAQAVRDEFYRLLNEYRVENGLRALEVNLELQDYADIRADELRILFSHTRPDGSNSGSGWEIRESAPAGYFGSTLRGYSENAGGSVDMHINPTDYAFARLNSWKNSPGHNRAMLRVDDDAETTIAFGISPKVNEYGKVMSPAILAFSIDRR